MKISVALCTYNGEVFIKEQIDSILQQTVSVDEIVICDDISSDNTIAILNEYATNNPNIFRIYKNDQNLRSVKNFEKAISLCTGDIIFLADQDDIWVPKKVEVYKKYFENNPRINILASNGYCINDKSEEKPKYAIWDVPIFLSESDTKVEFNKIISHVSNIATGATMAIRKNFLEEVIPFPIIKDIHHDEWMAIIAAHQNSFDMLEEKLFYYRIHDKQQVGGVFFDKTEKEKKSLTETFSVYKTNVAFSSYKKRLKRLNVAYERNALLRNYKTNHTSIFENNLVEIEKLFYLTQKNMKKAYPLSTFLLNLSDKILKKRQFKKL